jgi:hypothetical protein
VINSRRLILAGDVARLGERRGACRVLVEKPEGRRPLGRPKRRWENNIKIRFRELVWEHGSGLIWLKISTGGGFL